MTRAPVAIAILLVAAAGALAGCGSKSPAPAPAPSTAATPAATATAAPAPAAAAPSDGKPTVARCEQGREAYLAAAAIRVDEALAEAPPDRRAQYRRQGDDELAKTRAGFVDACMKMKLYD